MQPTPRHRLFVSLLGLLAVGPVCAQTHEGALESGDAQLQAGEYHDTYTLDVEAGQTIEADLSSGDFDPYLILRSPSGADEQNDDYEGSRERSYLRTRASESGRWTVMVTSYAAKETGRYRLQLSVEGGGGLTAGGRGDEGARHERGRLEQGDGTLSSGEFRDEYTLEGRRGQRLVLDLRATGFDPYLILVLPDGEQLDNDDHEGDRTRSLISTTLSEDGAYRVLVTSYQTGETGAYDLAIRGGEGDAAAFATDGRRAERGQLADGDETLGSGEFVDDYTFEGAPGQRVRLDLSSGEFDTYLILQPPGGEQVDNDDFEGNTRRSQLELDLTEPGTYRVLVTSYQPDERGAYELAMEFGQPSDGGPTTGVEEQTPRDDARLTLDQALAGALSQGDRLLDSGEFSDLHTFDGEAGEPVRIDLSSSDFDPYVIVRTPSGEQIDNDDADGTTHDARVEMVMPEAGRYTIQVTSYSAGETGPYQLRVSQADAMRPAPAGYTSIAGLFVGISDYGGRQTNLPYTAEDAGHARDAMVRAGMRPDAGVVLTDQQATRAAFRQAVQDLTQRSDENTLFVLFYSGHGGQYDRTGPQPADPDARDESIELYDGEILDDELAQLLAPLRARHQLIVLDACFSGGFSKDLIAQPGRMGLFSSEEDIVSAVATKFEAGGYLARFFADALAQRQADEDRNGAVTALELSTYLHERYNGDVRDEGPAPMQAGRTGLRHQQLVVDRGSIGPFDTLFLLP